jgi:hypothetical protein
VVLVVSALLYIVGWGLMALLERLTPPPGLAGAREHGVDLVAGYAADW